MRVLRYYPRALLGDGGMSGAVRRWSPAMARAGAEVTIAYDGPEGEESIRDGVRWVGVRHVGRGTLRVPMGIGRVIRDADLVVMHSGWTQHNVRAGMAARELGVPYVLEPRGAYDPHIVERKALLKRGWWAAWERRLVMGAAAVHVFFEDEQAHLHALGFGGPFIVASNGARAPEGATWDGGSGGYVLWLGRFDPEHKGLDLLLRAMAMLDPAVRPPVRLHGPDWRNKKATVAAMVDRLGLRPWVTVGAAAYGADKATLLSEAAAFVYPSRWDACPNSVLEAVAIGLPTVVTEYPLGPFLAQHGAAIGSEPTPGGLAAALPAALGPDARSIGEKGARFVAERLTWDEVARTWLEQAEAVLRG